MTSYSIPDYFHEAAKIFLDELDEHLRFFDQVLRDSAANPRLIDECAKAIAERFHLIRGSSGFLSMPPIHECATTGEKFFRDEIRGAEGPQSAGGQLKDLVTILHRERVEVRTAIGL